MLFLHLISCCFLTGLIWTVQLVHYPAFRFIEEKEFPAFHVFHSKSITWIVAPVMCAELATAALLAWWQWNTVWALNLLSVVVIWMATVLFSVPIHSQLVAGKNTELIARLVRTNWIRTIIWTLRLIFLCWIFWGSI